MDMKELTYLITIAEEKSISRAAEKLFMAQSSLSQALQSMETEMGGKLFVRMPAGVRPTEAGNLMIQYAQKMLLNYHEIKSQISDLEHLEKGRVDFGISTFRGSYLLPSVLHTLKCRHPQIQVEIHEDNSMALEQLLIDGKIDLALLALPLKKLKSQVRHVMNDEIMIVASKEHPIREVAKKTTRNGKSIEYIELEDTMNFEYILSDYDTILGSISRREFSKRNLVPRVQNANLTALFAVAMAKEGDGLAFTYRSCKTDQDRTSYYSIGKEGVFIQLVLAYAQGRYRSRAAQSLEKVLLEELEEKDLFSHL